MRYSLHWERTWSLVAGDLSVSHESVRADLKLPPMNAESIVKLIEEMVDLKVQQEAAAHLKLNPDVARLLAQKRETDRRRLEQIRTELIRLLNG